MAELSQAELDKIAIASARAVREELSRVYAQAGLDELTHADHHRWVGEQMRGQRRFEKNISHLRWSVYERVVGWSAVAAVAFFVGWLGAQVLRVLGVDLPPGDPPP